MKSSARTVKIMEYIVSAWLLLLSFYWVSIAELMGSPNLFFVFAMVTFLVGIVFLVSIIRELHVVRKILLSTFVLFTIIASCLTLFLAPACECKTVQLIDLMPQGIACLMSVILLFTRIV